MNELTPYDISVVGAMGDSITVSKTHKHFQTLFTIFRRLHLVLMQIISFKLLNTEVYHGGKCIIILQTKIKCQ